jgi:PAS domain S-box-containing protein
LLSKTEGDESKERSLKPRSGVALLGSAVLAISAAVIIARVFDPDMFLRIITSSGETKPNTAISLLLLGTSVLLLDHRRIAMRGVARLCAFFAAGIGALTLLEYLTGWNPGFDQFLYLSPLPAASLFPGRMSPVTAINIMLLGGAVILLDVRWRKIYVSSVLNWMIAALAFLSLTGAAFDPGPREPLRIFSSVSIFTSLMFLMLCAALMLARPSRGAAALFLSPDLGGHIVRRLLPVVVLLPFTVSLLTLRMYQHGAYGLALMVFLFVVAPVMIFVPLVMVSASLVSRIERGRRQSEEELRVSNQRFASVVGSAMDAIITIDESQHVVLFNEAAERVFGCPSWDAIGAPLDRFLPETVRHVHGEHIRTFGKSGHTSRSMASPARIWGLRLNGERFPIEATISNVEVEGQKFYTVILRDITSRQQFEESLMLSEARFRSLYEQVTVGIAQVALDGKFLMVNPALCQMLGYKEDQLLSKRIEEIIHPDDLAREAGLVERMKRSAGKPFEIEKRYLHRDHSPVWVNVSSSFVASAQGELLYRISVIQNITESKQAGEQLKQAQKLEAIGRLAGGVAHDFNTLLNVILGYSELLAADLEPGDPRRDRVLQIKNSSEAGALLTRQLLAFSRKQPLVQEVIDLREVVTRMTPLLARLLRDDIEMNVKCTDEHCLVKVDSGQMQQLILNLGANAGDAMPDGGQILIDVKAIDLDAAYISQHPTLKMGRYALLTIADSGVGMDAETAAHIFEPFFTTKEAGKGTGLGLATVYGIAKSNGGDIWVYSEVGVGTIFKIYLPMAEESERVHKQEASKGMARVGGGGETILLVEDSAALRELTKVILAREGYRVLEAEDGVAALELSAKFKEPIHLLLSDVVMPRMRGPVLAIEMRRMRPGIAVVFLSGYTEDSIVQSDGISGTPLVEKPYTAEVLLRSVRLALKDRLAKIASKSTT